MSLLLLCDRPEAVGPALAAHEAAGLMGPFAEAAAVLRRPATPEAREAAERAGVALHQAGRRQAPSVGLVGGDAVLVLSGEDRLCVPAQTAAATLGAGAALLSAGTAQAVRLRGDPGTDPAARVYRRYHGRSLLAGLRRVTGPGAARRAVGGAVLIEPQADRRHRGLIDRADDAEGTYLVSAAAIAWLPAPVMLDRAAASRRIAARGSIERDWHASGWTVAVPRGIFVGPEATTDRPRA